MNRQRVQVKLAAPVAVADAELGPKAWAEVSCGGGAAAWGKSGMHSSC